MNRYKIRVGSLVWWMGVLGQALAGIAAVWVIYMAMWVLYMAVWMMG